MGVFEYLFYGLYGSYTGDNKIQIALDKLNGEYGYDLIKTVIHELRHAYQHAAINNPNLYIVSQETIAAWQENLLPGNVISGKDDFYGYITQPIEWDTHNFAMQTDSLKDKIPVYEGSWSK